MIVHKFTIKTEFNYIPILNLGIVRIFSIDSHHIA